MELFLEPKDISNILNDIMKVAAILFQKGWSEKNAGNISIKLPDRVIKNEALGDAIPLKKELITIKNNCFYMTGTGKRMQDLAESAIENGVLVQIDNKGANYFIVNLCDKDIKPTSEFLSHLGIHNMIAERNKNETVVMHTHATELIALTQNPQVKSTESLNKILWGMHPETMLFIPKGVGFVPYLLTGSQEIADETIKSLQKHDIAVWEKHGVFAIGKNLIDTFDNIDIICKSAEIWFKCRSAGFEPEGLSASQLKELGKLVDRFS